MYKKRVANAPPRGRRVVSCCAANLEVIASIVLPHLLKKKRERIKKGGLSERAEPQPSRNKEEEVEGEKKK